MSRPTRKVRSEISDDDKAGTVPQSGKTDQPTHDAKDLTCNEAQVEELLSEGESTEDEAEGEEQA